MRAFADGDQENGVGDGGRGHPHGAGDGFASNTLNHGLGDGAGSGGANWDHDSGVYNPNGLNGDGEGTGGYFMPWD